MYFSTHKMCSLVTTTAAIPCSAVLQRGVLWSHTCMDALLWQLPYSTCESCTLFPLQGFIQLKGKPPSSLPPQTLWLPPQKERERREKERGRERKERARGIEWKRHCLKRHTIRGVCYVCRCRSRWILSCSCGHGKLPSVLLCRQLDSKETYLILAR